MAKKKTLGGFVSNRARKYTKYMEEDERRDFEISVVLSTLFITFYILLVGYGGISHWIKYELIALVSSIFFVMPLFETVKKQYMYLDLVSALIGATFFILYIHMSQWTFYETLKNYLEILIAFLLLRPCVQLYYRRIQKEGLRGLL